MLIDLLESSKAIGLCPRGVMVLTLSRIHIANGWCLMLCLFSGPSAFMCWIAFAQVFSCKS